MQMMQGSMLYLMPLMIAFFSSSVPAGVSLYWAVSTMYGIIQQIFVNRGLAKGASTSLKGKI
jgi:YidC/Oxa1 family membrane protein insertase